MLKLQFHVLPYTVDVVAAVIGFVVNVVAAV